ncbi:MAG: hypothetical protein EBR82_46825 [Caulobacteraceae bacterium]|nr:hypothetical protein [Caulobacteraceae bacterium]
MPALLTSNCTDTLPAMGKQKPTSKTQTVRVAESTAKLLHILTSFDSLASIAEWSERVLNPILEKMIKDRADKMK